MRLNSITSTMEVIDIKIGFIGAGKVGFSLGKYFKENGLTVTGYFSRSLASSEEAAKFTNTKSYLSLENIINESDAIFITTSDGEIINVWNQIKGLSIQNKIICHCSGTLSSEIFSNISVLGAYGYSIHPIFAISDKYNSYKFLNQALFTIEGHEKYINTLMELFKSLGNKAKCISTENKSLYHCSTVTVSNLVIGLINNGVRKLTKCGFNEAEAFEALLPLINVNINNLNNQGPINSLTGPLERGDLETIKKHYNQLEGNDLELYRLLSNEVLEVSKKKNKDRNYNDIEKFIGEKR